ARQHSARITIGRDGRSVRARRPHSYGLKPKPIRSKYVTAMASTVAGTAHQGRPRSVVTNAATTLNANRATVTTASARPASQRLGETTCWSTLCGTAFTVRKNETG